MKCPNCGEEVFDVYTTEQRIKDLYKAYTVLGWALCLWRTAQCKMVSRNASGNSR